MADAMDLFVAQRRVVTAHEALEYAQTTAADADEASQLAFRDAQIGVQRAMAALRHIQESLENPQVAP